MYDLRDWHLMPLLAAGKKLPNGTPYGRETHHTEGTNVSGGKTSKVYAYHFDTGKTMVFSKTPRGWPMDFKAYDANAIYDTGTENGWASASDFKAMSIAISMGPRFWDGDPTPRTFHTHIPYGVFTACKQTGSGDVGPGSFTTEGPYVIDFQGDVGPILTILRTYYWGDKKNREQLFLTDPSGPRPVGWVKWTHGTLTQLSPGTADYVIDSVSVHNKIVSGQVKPLFPCSTIP
jgi:hypothetical protein